MKICIHTSHNTQSHTHKHICIQLRQVESVIKKEREIKNENSIEKKG